MGRKLGLQGQDQGFVKLVHLKTAVLTPLPSVVLGLKDHSAKTHMAAEEAIVALTNSLGPETLIALLVVGLSSSDDHFKASTIACWTYIVKKFSRELLALDNGEQLKTMIKTATILIDWNQNEVRGAALDFFKAAVRPTPAPIFTEMLPTLLNRLMSWPDPVKTKFMKTLRYVLLKFIKKLDYQVVAQAMPKPHIKFLQNINDRYLHAKKKSKEGGGRSRHAGDDSDDSDMESDTESTPSHKMQVDGDNNSKHAKKTGRQGKGPQSWIREDEALDFTDTSATRALTSVDPAKAARKARAAAHNPFNTSEDGKLVITPYTSSSGADDDLVSPSKKRKRSDSTILPPSSSSAMDVSGAERTTRRKEEADSDDEAGEGEATKKAFRGNNSWKSKMDAMHRKPKLDPTANTQSQLKTTKAKRAGGDVSTSRGMEPHAYIKPNPAFLNKRHRTQSVKQYEGLVGGKKKHK